MVEDFFIYSYFGKGQIQKLRGIIGKVDFILEMRREFFWVLFFQVQSLKYLGCLGGGKGSWYFQQGGRLVGNY